MTNFSVSEKPQPLWHGGPLAVCNICKFRNQGYPWYLIFNTVDVELDYDPNEKGMVPGRQGKVTLCSDHATELKGLLDELLPDTRLSEARGKVLTAEAGRARAEAALKRAEEALHAMQVWKSEEILCEDA